jgi:hypothetical protein
MPERDDPLEALRAADPVDNGALPDHDHAAAAALLREITMNDPQTEVRARRWLPVAAAAAAVLAVAGVAFAVAAGDDDDEQPSQQAASTITTPPTDAPITPGGSLGSCVETYDLETLQNREVAFDGTVQSVEGDQVTFTVQQWFRGGEGDTVTLTSATGGAITPDAGAPLTPGARLLVAGDGGFAWACGFTQPYDEVVAADWAEALAGS